MEQPPLGVFADHEFQSLVGAVVTMTLASATHIHIALKKAEARAGEAFPENTRRKARLSAFSLIRLMFFAVVIVMAKPLLPAEPSSSSFVNGAAVLVVLFGILILVDLTKLAFSIDP
jgi:hypothetical protein